MYVIFEKHETRSPIKVWLDSIEDIDELARDQAKNLSNLPFIHKWIALMPDVHAGMGMPIGGVIACRNAVIPNAVGVDIGCGMIFTSTNIKVADVKDIETGNGSFFQNIVGNIMRNIPVGFNRHKKIQESKSLDKAKEEMHKYEKDFHLASEIDMGYYQVGTLGGGNHFIELQEDDNGYLCIMIHSGSRHFGKEICDYFNKIAVEINEKYHSNIPREYRLAFLPADSEYGKRYIDWMNLALDYAYENRDRMLSVVKDTLTRVISKHTDLNIEFDNLINCHHNYASIENHYGSNVWVHRKGATRARLNELAVIPGAMGSYSYVVRGLGNQESFMSCSHGAGRRYSRTKAKAEFSVESVMTDLKNQDVILGKQNKNDVAEESRFAYKDISEVMENQKDLVEIVTELKTIAVVKG